MAHTMGKTDIRTRRADDAVAILEVHGEVTAASEKALADAYGASSAPGTKAVIVDFTGLEYMNSGGIGLLVTMLVRANRQKQRLLAFGLNEHYRQIFELTRLDEAIGIHATEQEAVSSARA